MEAHKRRLVRTLFFIAASVVVAYLIMRLGTVDTFLASIGGLTHVGSFVAGVFFTSIFTAIPASVVLGELSLTTSPVIVALFGGVGAVVGDYILFLIVREGLSRDVQYVLRHSGYQRFHKAVHSRLLHRFLPLIGAIVLASPLPDEIGLAMLGLSKVNKDRFLLISLAANTIGILMIGLVAQSIAGV